jgi:3-oxoacyl-[acyl-carrier protein] reductase
VERGTVVVVTGAARGLGRALVEGLRASGAHVVGVCRPRPDGPAGDDPAAGAYLRVDADVTSEDDCARVVAAAHDRFGRVDVLVNNAAIAHDPFPKHHDSRLEDVPADAWRRVLDVNVTGPFLMARAAVPGMVDRGWGRVINVSTSKSSMLAAGVLPYGPSKAAVEAMTVGWAAQLEADGVTVNEVLPGGATGPRTPEKHWFPEGLPTWPAEMMVPPVRWLASRAADGVTGRRFVARLWDAALPDDEAAARCGFPAGWPLEPHDFARRPDA